MLPHAFFISELKVPQRVNFVKSVEITSQCVFFILTFVLPRIMHDLEDLRIKNFSFLFDESHQAGRE